MSKQGKWASILIMELAPSAPTWTRVSKPKNRRERFFIKTFCLPFWSRSRMSRRLVGKPVSRGYWIVIGCNAGQGSNRIFPNCPFCHQPAPPSSEYRMNFPPQKVNPKRRKHDGWWYKYFLFRRGNKSTESRRESCSPFTFVKVSK